MTSLTARPPSTDIPRLSITSNRSNRRSGIDFESALNANDTIYISTSTPIGEEPATPHMDNDAPEPIEKRSFEDDMKRMTPVKMSTPVVVPPTPSSSTRMSDRRVSTTASPLKSIGLDGTSHLYSS